MTNACKVYRLKFAKAGKTFHEWRKYSKLESAKQSLQSLISEADTISAKIYVMRTNKVIMEYWNFAYFM